MADHDSEDKIITRNPAMKGMINFLKQAATANSNVLITGETGTGKEVVANLIHKHSARAKTHLGTMALYNEEQWRICIPQVQQERAKSLRLKWS